MMELGVTDFTLSGGEPTIHPHFLDIVNYIVKNGNALHILSNGERFSDEGFFHQFRDIVSGHDVSVTTTLHSYNARDHELQNGISGSFDRTINGLKAIDGSGINLSIKQCLTRYNCPQLKDYLKMVTDTFSERVEIQLWGIDYVGINDDDIEKYFIDYRTLGQVIEGALDYFESIGRDQILNINNLPLCITDYYYWRYYSESQIDDYMEEDGSVGITNHGTLSKNCRSCKVRSMCMGAYRSTFEKMGDDIVSPPDVDKLVNIQKCCPSYDLNNIDLLYFSPYCEFVLTRFALHITNSRVGTTIDVRARKEGLERFIDSFNRGCTEEEAKDLCSSISDGEELLSNLLYFGVLE